MIVVTFRREEVLVETLRACLGMLRESDELIIVDQTPQHDPATGAYLEELERDARVLWLQGGRPSTTRARNGGALRATKDILIYVDDDVVPAPGFIEGHLSYYDDPGIGAVAGEVLYPRSMHANRSSRRLIGCNMSVRKDVWRQVGGFDTNFFGSFYREDTEFGERVVRAGWKVAYGDRCALVHLAAASGGAAARSRTDAWYYSTYHNLCYAQLKRPPREFLLSSLRYPAMLCRWYFPGWRRLLSPTFMVNVMARAHLHGFRTRLLGRRPPYFDCVAAEAFEPGPS